MPPPGRGERLPYHCVSTHRAEHNVFVFLDVGRVWRELLYHCCLSDGGPFVELTHQVLAQLRQPPMMAMAEKPIVAYLDKASG